MRILVSGAGGFIGSFMLKKFIDQGHEAIGIDNFSPYYSPEYKRHRLRALELEYDKHVKICDISNFSELNSIMSRVKPECIIHLGAQAGVRLKIEHYNSYLTSNIIGFQNVVYSASLNNVRSLVYASSSSVYGDDSPIPYKESSLILNPKSYYGVTKLSNELLAKLQSNSTGLRMRGLRFFTVYGPWGRPDMSYFRIAAAALGQIEFKMYGNGLIERDFTYIDDVIDCTSLLLEELQNHEPGFHDIVNIGGGRPYSLNSVIKLVESITHTSIPMKYDLPSNVDIAITKADHSYLVELIGQRKFVELKNGLESVLNWAESTEVLPNLRKWITSTI